MSRKKILLFLVPLLIILASGISAFNFSDEVRINQELSSERKIDNSQICMDRNGHVYVCWIDERRDELRFRHGLLQDDFTVLWDPQEKRIGDGDGNSGEEPQIICDDNGNVYVAWLFTRSDIPYGYIKFNYSTDHGANWLSHSGNPINDFVDTSRGEPSIACDGNGHVYIAWDDTRRGSPEIYFDYSHDGGNTWHDDTLLGPFGNGWGVFPKISCDQDGYILVTWASSHYPAGGIYFNRSSDYGVTWNQFNTSISHSAYPIWDGPSIANNGDGKVYVAWIDKRNGYRYVYLNYSHNNGTTWGTQDTRISDIDDYPAAQYLVLKCDQGNNVYAGWQDGTSTYITGAYFDYSNDGGITWHQDKRINTDLSSSGGGLLDMDADDSGFIYAVWTEERDEFYEIRMSFSTNFGVDWLTTDQRVGNPDQRCTNPKVAAGQWNGHSFAGIIWEKLFAPQQFDIYATRMWYLESGIAVTPGPGENNKPYVKIYDKEGMLLSEDFLAYNSDSYGAEVAAGKVEEGFDRAVITGPGPGSIYGPNVRGYGIEGEALQGLNFLAYGIRKYGVKVGIGDVDGDLDGAGEILTGPGPGEMFGPHVRIWKYDGEKVIPLGSGFFAYGVRKYGAGVDASDIDGDGVDEIITAPGPGPMFGAHVKCWKYTGGAVHQIAGFMAYSTGKYGVDIGGGNVDGDDRDEILTGPGPSPAYGSHVRGWRYENGLIEDIPGINFKAYQTQGFGCKVASGDIDWDGFAEILTMPGPGPTFPAHLRGFAFEAGQVVPIAHLNFFAFDASEYRYGGNVGVFSLRTDR